MLAHSLGSVVAYEALWAYPDLRVEFFATLGAPLGMPDVVFDTPRNRAITIREYDQHRR